MRLVFSKFSDKKLALNQLLISVNTPLPSFIKLVEFVQVIFRLVSSLNKTNLDLLFLSFIFVIFIISLIPYIARTTMVQVLNLAAFMRGICASNFKVEGLSSRLVLQCQNPENHSLNTFISLYAI
jgi:hypothetical protein